MAGVFAKLAPSIRRHPKCRDAGRDGTDVFIHALCANADRGATGVVPAIYMRARFVADELQMTEADAQVGIDRAVAAELLEVLPDGSVLIVGWDEEEWGRSRDSESMTEAERKRISRDKKREQRRADAAKCPDKTKPVRTQSGRPDYAESEEESDAESEIEVPAPPDKPPAKPRKPPIGDHATLIAAFDAAYQVQTGGKPTWGPKQGAIAKRILAAHALADCLERLERLFAGHLSWLSVPYAIGDLEQHFDKLAPVVNGKRAGPANGNPRAGRAIPARIDSTDAIDPRSIT